MRVPVEPMIRPCFSLLKVLSNAKKLVSWSPAFRQGRGGVCLSPVEESRVPASVLVRSVFSERSSELAALQCKDLDCGAFEDVLSHSSVMLSERGLCITRRCAGSSPFRLIVLPKSLRQESDHAVAFVPTKFKLMVRFHGEVPSGVYTE